MKISCSETLNLNNNINRFWNLDEIGIKEKEVSVYDKFRNDIKIKNERYSVRLPIKEYHPILPDHYTLCLKRLQALRHKLAQDEILLRKYDEIIKDQLNKGMIEEVTTEGLVGSTTYLPHRPVIDEERSSTKIRIVYDGSVKLKDEVSLNDILYTGPCLNPDLYKLLLQFRLYPIAITADIEKAYLQIDIEKQDRDYLRFLWFKNLFSNDNSNIVKYRFTRVIFGATCSQFLLNATVDNHIEKYVSIDPEFVKKVKGKFYVDDLNTGVHTVTEGIDLCKKLKLRFQEVHFNLRKWRTNNKELREFMKMLSVNNQIINNNTVNTESANIVKYTKVLGIEWDDIRDKLVFHLNETFEDAVNIKPTKRNILSIISTIYDPVGYLQPVTIQLKILFQEICKLNVGWDEVIDDLMPKWNSICNYLNSLQEIIIDRCYYVYKFHDPIVHYYLHGFSDSSLAAYASCVYLKCVSKSGNISIKFVTAKSRVVPLKKSFTIPRLELLGNFILSKLMSTVYDSLCNEIVISNYFCWTDSQISLSWIKAIKQEFKTFVENRVNTIRKLVAPNLWNYCKTNENPADLVTRINKRNFIDNNLWWEGPHFLKSISIENNILNNNYLINEENGDSFSKDFYDEIRSNASNVNLITCESTQNVNNIEKIIDIKRYSNFRKLLRVTSWILRFINNIKSKVSGKESIFTLYLNKEELANSKNLWLRANQRELVISDKFTDLQNSLRLQLHEDGLYRSTGRLNQGKSLPYSLKQPILLNRDHELTRLIVIDAHLKVNHSGERHTLAEVRNEYWIPRGKSYIKQIIKRCITCRKLNSRPYNYPQSPNLPAVRLNDDICFSGIGVDYSGALYCKDLFHNDNTDEDDMYKCYIVIYTCASTRGVILDVVPDATGETFINSLKKFISRRGCPQIILSDNGGPFIGDETQLFINSRNIKWENNLAKAPWYGGFWERLIGQVKRCLKKVLGRTTLDFYQLQTIIQEIELTLNSRIVEEQSIYHLFENIKKFIVEQIILYQTLEI